MSEPDQHSTGDPTAALLRRWHEGDREALSELLALHLEWMRGYVRRRLGDEARRRAETHDLVQETMIDVLTWGPRFEVEHERHFRALLAKIVENNIRDHNEWWRRRRRDMAREGSRGDSVLRIGTAPVTSPSQAADRAEQQEWIRLAMELLAPAEREIVVLREWDGLDFGEIGGLLGVPANTARMRFSRALTRLAGKFAALRAGAGLYA